MKKLITASIFILFFASLRAQLTVDSVITTPSICYNDGTLRLNVSGGTGPYQYVITNGPVLPNITYPILPDNANFFLSLHWGTYTFVVTDNVGNTVTGTATIPGNYEFPQLLGANVAGTIVVTPSLGLPPYLFALSSVGTNGPFGPYQSSNVFDSLCNGTYYARVLDSCGNFFTTPVTINQLPLTTYTGCFTQGGIDNVSVQVSPAYGNPPFRFHLVNGGYDSTNSTGLFRVPVAFSCPNTIYALDYCGDTVVSVVDCHPLTKTAFCSSFTDSTASISASGGTLPYIYNLYINNVLITSQSTGVFDSIPYGDRDFDGIRLEVVDACGRIVSDNDAYINVTAVTDCPFDGDVLVSVSGAIGGGTITCIDCSPIQSYPLAPQVIFTNLDTGSYTMRVLDACGETRDVVIDVPSPRPIGAVMAFTACNDVVVSAFSSDGDPLTTGVQFTLYLGVDSITTNTTGIFQNLSPGSYTVIAHVSVCPDADVNFYVPYFAGYCYTPYFDTLCELKMVVQYGNSLSDFPETYSLISGSTTHVEAPSGGGNGVYFNISPGTYTLRSDSGCAISQNFNFDFDLTETHKVGCQNTGDITLKPANPSFYTCESPFRFRYTLENEDGLISDTSDFGSEVTFTNLPADTFLAKVYFASDTVRFANNTLLSHGNQLCALDSMIVIIPKYVVPFLNSGNVTVCGVNDRGDIPFTVNGGFSPYTITIAGFPSITISSTSGVLPNIPIGSYTMIVNDSCGISSSFSVSVVDSCVDCDTIFARFTASDTTVCKGDTVFFQNVFPAAASYVWTVNGVFFSSLPNPQLVITSGGAKVVQCIISHFLCDDTFSLTIQAAETPGFELGPDTLICDAFTKVLSSGNASSTWSTGATGSSINISTPGLYWAEVSGACGAFRDSIRISQAFTPIIELGNDTSLCTGLSVLLRAFSAGASYNWSNGSNADNILVTLSGVYYVTVTSFSCAAVDSIEVSFVNSGTFELGPDISICDDSTITFNSGIASTVWSTGATDSSITVTISATEKIRGEVSGACGTFADSVMVFHAVTPSVNLGNDTILCVGDSLVLHAGTNDFNYFWNDGSTSDSLKVIQPGTYSVTAASSWCLAADSIVFATANINEDILIADSILCNGETIVLTPRAGTSPVWQDGTTGATFEVADSGIYFVTVNSPCGLVSDTVKIGFQLCPSELHIASAFTPNGDRKNDHFTVFGNGLTEYEIRIYNRWGELVYHSTDVKELNDLDRGWDGTHKGNVQSSAAFVYYVSAKGEDGKTFFEKGTITLIR